MTMTTNSHPTYVPQGTNVLNTTDGESGSIMNGFSHDPELGWYEYEVETHCGIERWSRKDFILFSEFEGVND